MSHPRIQRTETITSMDLAQLGCKDGCCMAMRRELQAMRCVAIAMTIAFILALARVMVLTVAK